MMDHNQNLKFYESPIFLNLFLLIVNVSLFILKLIFSFLTNSLALQADAFDTLTDIVMVFAALIGIVYSRKKPNEKFPYGYYKIENIISLIISFFIFITAYTIILQSIKNILDFISGNLKPIKISVQVFVFLIISFTVSLVLTFYLKIMGKKTNSPIIKSEASEKLYDNIISLSVLTGFIGSIFNLYFLDSIIGLIIALFIIKGGYDIFLTSTKTLLDAVIDFDNRNELYNMVKNFSNVKEIENLEIRSYGRYIFLEVVVILNKELHLHQIDLLKKGISNKIQAEFPQIFRIIIISQTQPKEVIKIAVPVVSNEALNSKISEHFGESPFFAILEMQEENNITLLKDYTIQTNKYINEEKRKGILISEWLLSEKIDKLYLKKELKKGPNLILENSFVQINIDEFECLKDIIEQEKQNQSS